MTLKAYEITKSDGSTYELLLSEQDKDRHYPDAKEVKVDLPDPLDSTFTPESYEDLRTPEDRAREAAAVAEAEAREKAQADVDAKARTAANKARSAAGKNS